MYTQCPLSATSSNRWFGRMPHSLRCTHGGIARSSAPAMMSVGVLDGPVLGHPVVERGEEPVLRLRELDQAVALVLEPR